MLKISNKKILLITTSTADNRVRILYNSGQKNGKIHLPAKSTTLFTDDIFIFHQKVFPSRENSFNLDDKVERIWPRGKTFLMEKFMKKLLLKDSDAGEFCLRVRQLIHST